MGIGYKYRKLFLSTFELSACTFGGGFVIIPLMRKKFVDELGWIEEEEMLDLTAICTSFARCDSSKCFNYVGVSYSSIPGAILCGIGNSIAPINNHFNNFNVLSGIFVIMLLLVWQ